MRSGVRGVLLDYSVVLAPIDDDNVSETASLREGAEFLFRKLRHSKIPTGICYGLGLSDSKVIFLQQISKLNSFDCIALDPKSTGKDINEVARAWNANGWSILHIVSGKNEELFPKPHNFECLRIVLGAEGGIAIMSSTWLHVDRLEQLPFVICNLNRKAVKATEKDALVVGYVMKPSREEDFAKLQQVDVILHKATDEIVSIELSSLSDCSNEIIYSKGMQELQRFIDQQPDCCVIDPFNNLSPIVDRLRIQEILLRLENFNSEGRRKIRGPRFLKVDNFDDPNLEQLLLEAKLSQPTIVKPQVACGVAHAHSMAIVFRVHDYGSLSVPLPAVVQEYVDHSSTIYKFYVLGDEIFHAVKQSIPNSDVLVKLSEKHGCEPLIFDSLKSLPIAKENQSIGGDSGWVHEQQHLDIGLVMDAASCLKKMLDLTIFGFDVVVQDGSGDHVIVDVNYLPSFKEVPDDIAIPAFWDAIRAKYESSKIIKQD